jgi:N-acetylmuramic acid 6-phosphate etherase
MDEHSPTEAIHEATRDLDCWSVERILRVIHAEDANAHAAVTAVLPQVAAAVEVLVVTLAGGGTWFNVGAGTSGRIGIAGGERALWQAVEGAEDQPERAAWELRERGLSAGDAVLAISASGRTPFTLSSLEVAHDVGARSIGLTCNPHSPLAEAAELAIVPEVGPEVIAGSTRMKGGLAQKMVLHLLSTTTMVRLGHVSGNLMSSLSPASEKLWDRAVRIIMVLGGLDRPRAETLLRNCDGDAADAARRAQHALERRERELR